MITTTIEEVLLRERADSFVTNPVHELNLFEYGIAGSADVKHVGHFVVANVRNDGFHKTGEKKQRDVVFNHRQISIIDELSLTQIGDGLDIDPEVVEREYDESRTVFIARHIGANVVVGSMSNGQNLHNIDPPYHLGPFDHEGLFTAAMLVISYNEPCVNPGRSIAAAYPGATESMGRKFVEVARACRGFVGVTSLPGMFVTGSEAMVISLPKVPHETEA